MTSRDQSLLKREATREEFVALESSLYGLDAQTRDEGRAQLIASGSSAELTALVGSLSATLSTTRRRAARLLGDLQPHRALPPLRVWVKRESADEWSQSSLSHKPTREGLVSAARLMNQLTPRGEREIGLLILWSAPSLKIQRATICPASPDQLLAEALKQTPQPELRELAAAEALRRLQRLDPAYFSEQQALISTLISAGVSVQSFDHSCHTQNISDTDAEPAEFESSLRSLNAYQQLLAHLDPSSPEWTRRALCLEPLGLRACQQRAPLLEALRLAVEQLSPSSGSPLCLSSTSSALIETLTALERVTLSWSVSHSEVTPERHNQENADAHRASDLSTSTYSAPLSGVSDDLIDALLTANDPAVRSLTARLLPQGHPRLSILISDPHPDVAWRAQATAHGRSSVKTLQARLGRHRRLELPSAQPPYGLRAFDQLPEIPRVAGALALCQARFDVNLGVAMRSAEAAGLSEVFVVGARSGSLTSARGAEHALPVTWFDDPESMMIEARRRGYQLVAVQQTPDSEPYHHAHYPPCPLFVLGSEDAGLPDALRLAADLVVEIPLYGAIDSLNVSTAATCVIMHWRAHLDA